MRDFDQLLQEDVAGYAGHHAEFIGQVPALYRLLTRLLEDPQLPGRLRPLVLAVIAYFTLPVDIIPEDLTGPSGYIDDVFLCAVILERVSSESGGGEILENNWDGDGSVTQLMGNILAQEQALVGDRRELILWYIGYEYLV